MKEVSGLGSYGIVPFMSEDLLRQLKYVNIKTRAGKIAYLMTLGDKASKPSVTKGIYEARGALKWITKILEEEEK